MTRRQAAKHFNISRDSVAKMVAYSIPPGYQRRSPIRRPKLEAFAFFGAVPQSIVYDNDRCPLSGM